MPFEGGIDMSCLEFRCRFYSITCTVCAVLIAIPTAIFSAEIPELTTDRPDQTESSVTILPGFVQIETGVTHSSAGDHSVTELPGTLVRIGVTDRIELRIGTEGWIIDDELDTRGFGDSEVGVKLGLFEENGWIPKSSLLAGFCIPTAKTAFEGKRFDPKLKCSCRHTSVRWTGSNTITDRLSSGYNLGVGWECEKEGGHRHMLAYLPYSVAFGYGVTDRLGVFGEFFGSIPVNPGGKPSNLIDAGFTFLVLDNFQLDLAGGAGLSDAAEDWFVGAGASYRIPR